MNNSRIAHEPEEKEESDLSKIVYPEDLGTPFPDYSEDRSSSLSLKALLFEAYFFQRLGKEIPKNRDNEPVFPAIIVERSFFLSLLEGEYPLWAQMYDEAPEAWEEWFIIDNPKKPGSVILSMPIDQKGVGIHSLDFIQRCHHPMKEELLECCKKLKESCNALYSLWEKRKFRFVSFERLPKGFVNRRHRLQQATRREKVFVPYENYE
ncbi:hypothetical protein [Candidatus Methylacidiphilum infernorum]|uniref:Uncharacterized protein n=1 Tax=Methylacidiphilum infernorum (isolate V4) TaxID=481448 RepID=B3DV70_METI4|nr:hypothetical protein [Candidatus Methylacidiphilum infernorum]ACD83223.1 Hypothetical protein Minf_1168 [Methylacidiphilum infernorum V4]